MQDFEETGEAGLTELCAVGIVPFPRHFVRGSIFFKTCQVELRIVLPGDDPASVAETAEKSTESYDPGMHKCGSLAS